MLFEYNEKYEPWPEHIVPGNFSYDDPCVWIVYPAGAAGDLLASIVNQHYRATGCRYWGISNSGQVIFRPTDNKITNMRHSNNTLIFNEQWLYDVADALAEKNLCHYIVDQYIFSNHMHRPKDIELILNTFSQARVINITVENANESALIKFMAVLKNHDKVDDGILDSSTKETNLHFEHERVLNVPFSNWFNRQQFEKSYDEIVTHLNLNGRVIDYNLVEFWKSKQHSLVQEYIREHF